MGKNIRLLFLVLLLLTGGQLFCQVTVTAVPPPARFTLDDLWSITLVKNNAALNNQDLNVQLNVYDKKAQKVISATTNKFQFKTVKILNINRATISQYQPINIAYYDNKLKNKLTQQGGTFPSGSYKVEIVVNAVGAGYTEPLGKYSYNINAELAYPIKLLNVYNKDTIKELNPTFTWIPPYPLPAGNVDYEITIAEIMPNQTPDAALLENQPVIKKTIPNQNAMYYSPANPKFINGKDYAWNVKVVQGGNLYSQSEVWSYSYRLLEDSSNYEPESYYLMERELKNAYATVDSNILPIKFTEDYKVLDSISQIRIYDNSYELVATEEDIPLSYKHGSNYTFLNFCPDVFSLSEGLYVLEIILVNDNKYYLRFKNIVLPEVCIE